MLASTSLHLYYFDIAVNSNPTICVCSLSSIASNTPTQQFKSSWTSTPSEKSVDTPLDIATLARWLNLPDRALREGARILSYHLKQPTGIMTHSRYQHEAIAEHSHVLLASRPHFHSQSVADVSSFHMT